MSAPMPGGLGGPQPANEEIQKLVDHLASEIKAQTGKQHPHLKAVSYKTQVVAGTNYIVKVDAGNNEHIHVKIHKPLPVHGTEPKLSGVQSGKTLGDELIHF